MSDRRIISIGAPMLPDPGRVAGLMAEVIAAEWFSNGGALHLRLERALAAELGVTGAVGLVSSGTMALMLALRLGDLPEGAEVITTPLTFAATAQAIAWCGFKPVFADVDPVTLTLCPRAVEAAITKRTAAILPVHFLGMACDVSGLADVADRHGLWLVYDAAHAFGQSLGGRSIGDFGDSSAFSLHATKVLHTGEGGFVTLPAGPDRFDRLRRMRNFGLEAGVPVMAGLNGKLSEAQAAIGLALLPELAAEVAARHRLRGIYDAGLRDLPGVAVQSYPAGATPGLTCYPLRLAPDLRAQLVMALAEERVLARDALPLLTGPGALWAGHTIVTAGPSPVAPTVAPELIWLPFHGRVSDADAARIIARVAAVVGGRPK